MSRSRLATVLDDGLALPAGDILAMRPRADADLSPLLAERLRILHGFRPERDAFAEAGHVVVDEAVPAGTAVVFVPRSKALAHAMIEAAARTASLVIVDGQRTEGVDSLWREVRARRPQVEGLAQAHGRLFWFDGGPGFEDWAMPAPARGEGGLFTQPGVFGEGGADAGSLMLAEALPARLPPRMADLGAGIGTLALAALSREGVASLDLVEAERLALDCARLNLADPRARFLWADATRGTVGPYDGIVMNPPFHAGRAAADPGLGRAFIAAAARALTPQGQLWMVANRHLPYEAALAEAFRDVAEIGAGGGYKLVHASHPKGRAPFRASIRAPARQASRDGRRPAPRGRHPG